MFWKWSLIFYFWIYTTLKRKSNFWGLLPQQAYNHLVFWRKTSPGFSSTYRSKPKLLMLQLIWAHCWVWTWEPVSQGRWGSPGVDDSQIRLSLQLLFLCMLSLALKHCSSVEKLEKYQPGSHSQPQQQCRRTYLSQLWVHKKCHKGTGVPTLFVTHLFPSLIHVPAHSLCLWVIEHYSKKRNWDARDTAVGKLVAPKTQAKCSNLPATA